MISHKVYKGPQLFFVAKAAQDRRTPRRCRAEARRESDKRYQERRFSTADQINGALESAAPLIFVRGLYC
jgi:hypothetical protein